MQLRTIQFHTLGPTSVVASLLLLPSACATAPTPTAVAPPAGPADVAFNRLREDEVWARQRRQQLDVLFGRVVDATASPAALDWLRVYVLAQVADREDRGARTSDVQQLESQIDRLTQLRDSEEPGFQDELAQLRDEVRGLHELYAEPLAVTAVSTEK